MKINNTYKIVIIIMMIAISNIKTNAHPGNTASDGCHYCRTRCDYWGVPWNKRHCHGTKINNTTPRCPSNSYYDSVQGKCFCNQGYCVNVTRTGCVYLPANAHCVDSTTDAWLCNLGYEEIGNYCVKKDPPKINSLNLTNKPYNNNPSNKSAEYTLKIRTIIWGVIALCSAYIYIDIKKQ